jgi:L-glyceraldehyde 3-phosphate reductase
MPLNETYGMGFIVFSPLAQGLLTNKYLTGIPENSRAAKSHGFLKKEDITGEVMDKILKLNALALQRGQTLAEMSLAWLLNKKEVTSVIVGTSSVKQLQDNIDTIRQIGFTEEELKQIDRILN